MKFAAVDNDPTRLAQLSELLKSVFPNCAVTEFTDPLLSAKYIQNNEVDAVLAETAMRPADGPTLKKVILTNKPDLKVVLLTDHPLRRATDTADAAGSILQRPVTAEKLRDAVTPEA
jgi:DNA-binding NarL/FixJ family response regulator